MCTPSRHFGKNPAARGANALGTSAGQAKLYGALHTRQEILVAASAATHSPAASSGGVLILAGIASSRHRCRDWSGRLFSRKQQPAGSSTGARSWPWSGQEIRWRQCRGCACYTYHSDARPNLLKLSESLAGTTRLFLCRKPGRDIPNRQPLKTQALER